MASPPSPPLGRSMVAEIATYYNLVPEAGHFQGSIASQGHTGGSPARKPRGVVATTPNPAREQRRGGIPGSPAGGGRLSQEVQVIQAAESKDVLLNNLQRGMGQDRIEVTVHRRHVPTQ